MRIAMLYPNNPPFDWRWHEDRGLGGSENGMLMTAKHLAARGHQAFVYNQAELPPTDVGGGLNWANISFFRPSEEFDVIYSLRHKEPFEKYAISSRSLRVLFLADTESNGLGETIRAGKIDLVMAVSHWQKEKIQLEEHIPGSHWMVTSNGVEDDNGHYLKAPGKCIFMGTPERGLNDLLTVWPRIKSRCSQATLDLYSSFLGWGVTQEQNNDMCRDIYARIRELELMSVVNHIHANAREIRLAQQTASVYLYPSHFYETCGMAILESMLVGTIPIAVGRAGILEKVTQGVTGRLVPAYGEGDSRFLQGFEDAAVEVLSRSEGDLTTMRKACSTYAKNFTYDVLVERWENEWLKRLAEKRS